MTEGCFGRDAAEAVVFFLLVLGAFEAAMMPSMRSVSESLEVTKDLSSGIGSLV